MQQVIQNVRNGRLSVIDVPDPIARPGQVLIANAASVISAGTEKMTMELASKSLIGKARQRPDQVRRVIEKMRQEGFFETLRQVREKLDEPLAMGYSSAGTVLGCGAGVQQYRVGDRVASNGPHAGIVSVPVNLCGRIADHVPFEHACFAVLGSIAMQGVRLSRAVLGETVFVIGLGLVGQLTVMILQAAGCRVIGTDLDARKCELASKAGAVQARPGLDGAAVDELTEGRGADAVIITASTPSNAPIEIAAEAIRPKGRVVLVGVVGLDVPRRPFYFKEAEFVVSCSYGPGRYDADYEQHGHDYPLGHVRWTEQRNIQSVLDLMATGGIDPSGLISHRFSLDDAESAYALIESGGEPYLGIVLEYPPGPTPIPTVTLRARAPEPGRIGVGCIGAGNFARVILLPALARADAYRLRALCSAGGLSAATAGDKLGFEVATTREEDVFADPEVDAVFVLTQHDQHARLVIRAIEAGKHVFVEKPLALTVEQLRQIEEALASRAGDAGVVMVGFNRRFSPAAASVREFFSTVAEPLTVSVRFNAGAIPADSWVQDDAVGGGRIIGEACHGIDLATYLVQSPPARVFAESIGGPAAGPITDDQCFITLRHANGSVSSVAYLAGGDRSLPKERVEVLGGGQMAIIDDFRTVTTAQRGKSRTVKQPGKGHAEEVVAFARSVRTGAAAPIAWLQLRAVTLASILAVRSLREGIPFDLAGDLVDDRG